MNAHELAQHIFYSQRIEDKLTLIQLKEANFQTGFKAIELGDSPGRSTQIGFSEQRMKFPKKGSFDLEENRARAIHFFANHELLAIEMCAAALIMFETMSQEDINFKRSILATLVDEQSHFKLYIERLNAMGYQFGDFPRNDFFWKTFQKIKTKAEYFSLVSLTFEQANLDFAFEFMNIFQQVGDKDSAKILKQVFDDEINHVRIGGFWLSHWKNDRSLWEYYLQHLPEFVTPARAKGSFFQHEARVHANLPIDFIERIKQFEDSYRVTRRKEWS